MLAVHIVLTTYYLLLSSQMVDKPLEAIFNDAANGDGTSILLLIGWLLSTVESVVNIASIFRQIYVLDVLSLFAYMSAYEHVPGVVYNVGQLVTNVLFLLRDLAPAVIMAPGPYDEYDGFGDRNTTADSHTTSSDDPIGVFLTIQSLVMVALYARALLFFRGFLSFGHLMYITIETVKSTLPFMILLIVLVFGFALAQSLLLIHVGQSVDTSDFSNSLFLMINAGFGFFDPRPSEMRYGWQLIFWFELFMWAVQLVLMNLLIATMTRQLDSLAHQGNLMALYERAKLCLDLENRLISRSQGIRRANSQRRKKFTLQSALASLSSLSSLSSLPERDLVSPLWLHVLLPPVDADKGDAADVHERRVEPVMQVQGPAVPNALDVTLSMSTLTQNSAHNHAATVSEITKVREEVHGVSERLGRLEEILQGLATRERTIPEESMSRGAGISSECSGGDPNAAE